MKTAVVSLLAAAALSACASFTPKIHLLSHAQVTDDFDTYALQRVGVMPFQGDGIDADRGHDLELAFYTEFSLSTPFEFVLLDETDLEEVRGSEPHRMGWYSPATILEAAQRYNLDAILFGTVVREQLFPPQELSVQVDLVAAETGLVIWSASVHVDASDPRVREGLEAYFGSDRYGAEPWQLSLVSPSRFARFTAFQIASLL